MTNISHSRRWRSSERIALYFLEKQGYRILDVHVPVKINDVEVSEVDAIAEDPSGIRYAVEVKAGSIDVNGVRQAYVNANVLGLKPLIIGKGFSDKGAEKLAEKLGVKVIQLSDYFLVNAEELEIIVRGAVEDTLLEIISSILNPEIDDETLEVLQRIAESRDYRELAEKLGVDVEEIPKIMGRLRGRKIIPKNIYGFRHLRTYALLVLIGKKLYDSLADGHRGLER